MKKKRYTASERAAMFKPTYFFGYGSLMQPSGINGRGMVAYYRSNNLRTASLRGYKRSMYAYFGGRNFYGLLEDKDAHCNGVVFKIANWYDYRALLINEGATSFYRVGRTYWPIDVTSSISGWEVPEGHRVITLVCREDQSNVGRIERRYIRICHNAAVSWGSEFEAEFLRTGGIPYDRKQMKAIAKKHSIKLW